MREILRRHEGREVDTAGDGFLAIFALASKALGCALEMRAPALEQGVHLRVGLHAGEVTVRAAGVTGMAVHVAARVAALAGEDDVLVTGTLAGLLLGVTGTPALEVVGEHELKGVPGRWRLVRVAV